MDQSKEKIWAELSMLSVRKKGRKWHFNYASILEHKRERKDNLQKNNKKLSMESFIQDSKTR